MSTDTYTPRHAKESTLLSRCSEFAKCLGIYREHEGTTPRNAALETEVTA